jgi:hypothetical protein
MRERRLGPPHPPIFRCLHLKRVGVKRPIRNAAEALVMSLRSFYCTIDVFSAADVDRMLETFEGMAIGTKQRLKKTHSIPAHVRTPYAQKIGVRPKGLI